MKIAVFLAESPWGDIDDSAMGKGLGGRETALVCLALEWAKLGHDVYAFVPRQESDIIEHEESGGYVRWIPNQYTVEITEAVQPDLFVSWENTAILEAIAHVPCIKAIEMQVAHLEHHLDSQYKVSDLTDYICVLSEWAGDFIRTQHTIEPERVKVFANGVNLARFDEGIRLGPAKDTDYPYSFIYSSSPDRGLHHLLKMWPMIQDMVGSEFGHHCELHVCYGIENFIAHSRWSHREDGVRALEIEQLIEQQGIVYHGKVGQDKLAELMHDCDLMLYPADTMSPTETGCISIVEALAAGTPVVTTDCDCIGPDYGEITTQVPLPFMGPKPYDQYIEAILDALDPEDYQACVEAGREFVKQRDWSVIAKQWIDFFEPLINN